MTGCCGERERKEVRESDPCQPAEVRYGATEQSTFARGPFAWFEDMISHCLEYATAAKAEGRPVVGILCEYAPRELILAAGAVPVCLCGGSAEMIGPAENDLPSNLCPLIKSTYGYHVEKANPFLEMADIVVAETTCDGKKKMYELMARTREMVILELPQKPKNLDALNYWCTELKKFKVQLEERFKAQITDERLRHATRLMNEERRLRRDLAYLMAADAPAITGRQLLDLKSIISCIESDLDMYRLALKEFQSQSNPQNAQKTRVLLTGVPTVHGAERVVDLIEEAGGLIVCMENCTGLKPIWEDVDENAEDLLSAIAHKYMSLPCSVMSPNDGRLAHLIELARVFRPDCVVDLSWQACLTYDVESWRLREWAEQIENIPYLRISTEYSPSDSARIRTRLEALYETVKSRKP